MEHLFFQGRLIVLQQLWHQQKNGHCLFVDIYTSRCTKFPEVAQAGYIEGESRFPTRSDTIKIKKFLMSSGD